MAKKSKVAAIPQIAPSRRLIRPHCYPIIQDDNVDEKVYRPARSVSMLIKQGLVKGISKDISNTNGNSYDNSEGKCPKGLRLDVDKFDLATTMLRAGGDSKTITKEMTKTDD